MSLPILNGLGRVIDDPELRFSASGTAIVRVRLAFNSRKKDQAGEWKDDASFFVTGTAFGQAAENIAESLQRATEVVVSGRLKTDSYEKDGQKQSRTELLIDSIGPALHRATAKVEKNGGSGRGREEFQQARQQQPADDPWAASAPAGAGAGWGGASGGGYSDEPPF